jgi:hypothetical protein
MVVLHLLALTDQLPDHMAGHVGQAKWSTGVIES